MDLFLDKVNASSLILLDEFGSGSDPELGGALAEVFYEELYNRNCFAVINTHYTNIKILTSKKVRYRFVDKDIIIENWGEIIELDENGQPVIITSKGAKKLLSCRLTKLHPGTKTPKQILMEKRR